jgi:hypothetical protein
MAGIGKNLQFRTFDPTMKELGILYRGELVIISAEDKRGKTDFLYLIHEVEPVTGKKVAEENLCSTLQHHENTLPN